MHVLCDLQIVMQVIVAFILEAFVFRIQYRMVMNGQDMSGTVLLHHNSIIIWIESLHCYFCTSPVSPFSIYSAINSTQSRNYFTFPLAEMSLLKFTSVSKIYRHVAFYAFYVFFVLSEVDLAVMVPQNSVNKSFF